MTTQIADQSLHIETLQTTAIVENGFLRGIEPLPQLNGETVQIVVIRVKNDALDGSEIDEKSWHRGIASNPAFEFLADASEDVYSWEDGTSLPALRTQTP